MTDDIKQRVLDRSAERIAELERQNTALRAAMFDLVNRRAKDEPSDTVVEAFQILEDQIAETNALRRRVFELELQVGP